LDIGIDLVDEAG